MYMTLCSIKEKREEFNMSVREIYLKSTDKRYYRADITINRKRRTKNFPFNNKGLRAALKLSKEWEQEKLEYLHEKTTKRLVSRSGLFRGISYTVYEDVRGYRKGLFPIYLKAAAEKLSTTIYINKYHSFDEAYDIGIKKILNYMGVKNITPEIKELIEKTRNHLYTKHLNLKK